MPNQISNVGFGSPGFDYGADLSAIERQRALALQLQNEAAQPVQSMGPPGSHLSWTQGLAKAFQGYQSGAAERSAEQQQRGLAQKAQSDYSQTLARGLQQLRGTPASEMPGSELSPGYQTPSVAPDPEAAMGTFGSHPMTQAMMPLAQSQIQRQMLIQALRGGQAQPAPAAPQQPPQNPMVPNQPGSSVMAGSGQTTPQAQPQQQNPLEGLGGPAGGVPMEVWLEADPSGKTYMEHFAKDRALQNVRPGGTVYAPGKGALFTAPMAGMQTNWGPNGPTASVVPNAQELEARGAGLKAGAQAAGQAPYQLGVVNTPGSPTLMTHQQQIEQATGRPMPVPWGPNPQPGAQGGGSPVPGSPLQIPGAPRRGGLTLQDQGDSRAQVEIGEGLGKRYNSIQDAGFGANQKINKISRLGSLLENLNTGKLAPAGFELSAYAKSLGIPMDAKLDNAQAAKALANEFALELRNPSGGAGMPGAMSDADRNYLQSLVAGLDKTPGANKLLVDATQKMAERDKDVARLAREYKKKHGKFDEGFFDDLNTFSAANPMFGGTEAAPNPNTQKLLDRYAPTKPGK